VSAFLPARGIDRWTACPGSAALCESVRAHDLNNWVLHNALRRDSADGYDDSVRVLVRDCVDRAQRHVQAGAVIRSRLVAPPLPIGQITGEDGACDACDLLLIADYAGVLQCDVIDVGASEATLELHALAAVLQFGLLSEFAQVNCVSMMQGQPPSIWARTPADLYVIGARVTQAAALPLALRGETGALSHLTPGAHCESCAARAKCPAVQIGADLV